MAAFDATTLKPLAIEGMSLDQIRKEASFAIPGATDGPFVAYSLDLATAALGTEDVITAPGSDKSLFIVSIDVGPRTSGAIQYSMAPAFGVGAYDKFLPGINAGAGGTGAAPNPMPKELLVKLPGNAKFGLQSLHATQAMLHRVIVRFCVVKA